MALRPCWLVLVLLVSPLLAAEPLHVYVGAGQMPFADDHPAQRGIFGELMDELCRRLSRECQYIAVPWRRVQHAVPQDRQGIVLNLGRSPEREAQFRWLLPVMETHYRLASPSVELGNLDDALQAGPVAVMAGTPRAEELQTHRLPGQEIIEINRPEQAVALLQSGRALVWYEIDARIRHLWPASAAPLRFGPPLGSTVSYIAASPALQDAAQLSRAMREQFAAMQADGSWQRILRHYHLPPQSQPADAPL